MFRIDNKENNDSSQDKKILIFIFGGIFVAFFVGLLLLFIAVFSDWQFK